MYVSDFWNKSDSNILILRFHLRWPYSFVFLYVPRHSMPMWLTPNKTWTPWLGEPSWMAVLCICCHMSLLEELSMLLCDSTGRGHLEHYAWFLLDFISYAFVDFNLYQFAIINHNHDSNRFFESYEFCQFIEPESTLEIP